MTTRWTHSNVDRSVRGVNPTIQTYYGPMGAFCIADFLPFAGVTNSLRSW